MKGGLQLYIVKFVHYSRGRQFLHVLEFSIRNNLLTKYSEQVPDEKMTKKAPDRPTTNETISAHHVPTPMKKPPIQSWFMHILILSACFIFSATGFGYETWLTRVPHGSSFRIVNPGTDSVTCQLEYFNHLGQRIEVLQLVLPAKGLGKVVQSNEETVQLRCVTPSKVHMDLIENREGAWYEQTGRPALPAPAMVPHIARQTDYWNTEMRYISPSWAQFQMEHDGGEHLLEKQPPYTLGQLDLETLLPDNPFEDPGWRRLTTPFASIVGNLLFYNQTGSQSAVLPIHYEQSTYLILPHLPSDQNTWWTGLVLLNPSHETASVTINWHLQDTNHEPSILELAPGEKQANLIKSFLPTSASGGWAEIHSDQAILGFELFGTRNEQSLCGLPLTQNLSKRWVFSRIGTQDTWSGLAILNPGPVPITLTLNQYQGNGELSRSDPLAIDAFSRIRFIPESEFPVANPESTWLELKGDNGFLAFQLVGNSQQTGLAALYGSTYGMGLSELSLTQTFQAQRTSTRLNTQVFDLDGDQTLDFISTSETGIDLKTNLSEDPETTHYSYEDMDLELEGVIPPPLSVTDLDKDGNLEFLILDRSLHIFTRTPEEELRPFQDYLLDLEGADRISGYADTNRDGFLEILTPRGYFKSLATLQNPYTTNNFPFQLRTSGTASQFMDLNGDGLKDLLTSLLGEIHAFLSYGSTDDLGPPIYVPDPTKYILQMFQHDMDGDGSLDLICLLGDHINSPYGTELYILNLQWEESTFLGSLALPEDLAIGSLELLHEGGSGTALFKQQLAVVSRYIEFDLNGIKKITYRTGAGHRFDLNRDGRIDQVAPWSWTLTEPNGLERNPAFQFHDDLASSGTSKLFHLPEFSYWISSTELAMGSAYRIQLWQEKGSAGDPTELHRMNLPISRDAYLELYDHNKDGLKDLLVAGSGLTVYYQHATEPDSGKQKQDDSLSFDNTPTFIHPPNVFTILDAMRCNLDGNAFPDLIGQSIDGRGNLHIVFDYMTETPSSLTLEEQANLNHLSFFDLNGDGFTDILIQYPDDSNAPAPKVKINSGQRSFTNLSIPEEFKASVAMDIRGTGFQDIVGYIEPPESTRTYLRILKNNQNLDFSYGIIQEIEIEQTYRAMLAMDIDNDGRDDLLGFVFSNDPYIDIWFNRWTPETRTPFEFSHSVPIHGNPEPALVDRNRDGRPDLELRYPGIRAWLLNKASYYPQTHTWTPESNTSRN